jgi:glucose uptake protein GlcU
MMLKTLRALLITGATALYTSPIHAAFNKTADDGAGQAHPNATPSTLFGGGGIFHTISNILIFLTGAIAVIVIIFGGLRYTISTGDAARVKQAKDTILYGIVGLVIAILAYAIVNFVTNNLKG